MQSDYPKYFLAAVVILCISWIGVTVLQTAPVSPSATPVDFSQDMGSTLRYCERQDYPVATVTLDREHGVYQWICSAK
jgi:hypothetical protein